METLPHLAEWRKRAGISQREMARRAGITQMTAHRVEALGKPAQPRTVRDLAAALGITADQLRTVPPTA